MTDWIVPLSDVSLPASAIEAAVDQLQSGWLSQGPATSKFERDITVYLGGGQSVAVTNGTAALHLACRVAQLGPGDEVIVPSLTFVATVNAVLYTRATPIFCDIESVSVPYMSVDRAKDLITPMTKAIMLVHYAGFPANVAAFRRLADEHDLLLIEDASHALGSQDDGIPCGLWGDIGCFSFFANKNLPLGEGGMLTTKNSDFAKLARDLRSHAMTSLTWDRHSGHASSYDVTDIGYNYRIDEVRSSLGSCLLRFLDEENQKRRLLSARYRALLADISDIEIPFLDFDLHDSAAHLFPILVQPDQRQHVRDILQKRRIQSSIHYPPVHLFTAFSDFSHEDLRLTEEYAAREITLPLFPRMTAFQQDQAADAFSVAMAL